MKRWLIALGLAVLCLPARHIQAQAASGRISGTVSAETGEPVPGASVVVLGTRLGTKTDAGGRYIINGVATGLQRVRASMIGFTPVIMDSVPVLNGQQTPVDFKLTHSAMM